MCLHFKCEDLQKPSSVMLKTMPADSVFHGDANPCDDLCFPCQPTCGCRQWGKLTVIDGAVSQFESQKVCPGASATPFTSQKRGLTRPTCLPFLSRNRL